MSFVAGALGASDDDDDGAEGGVGGEELDEETWTLQRVAEYDINDLWQYEYNGKTTGVAKPCSKSRLKELVDEFHAHWTCGADVEVRPTNGEQAGTRRARKRSRVSEFVDEAQPAVVDSSERRVVPSNAYQHLMRCLQMDENGSISIIRFHDTLQAHLDTCRTLHAFAIFHRCFEDADGINQKLGDVMKVMGAAREFFSAATRFTFFVGSYQQKSKEEIERHCKMASLQDEGLAEVDWQKPSKDRWEAEMDAITSTTFYLLEDPYTSKKLNAFQSCFLYLRRQLDVLGYRKADGKYFGRVQIPSMGYPAMAFEERQSIDAFVSEYLSHAASFTMWTKATSNTNPIHKTLVDYLTDRELQETPQLTESHWIRSYKGDRFGRGAVVYCAHSDFAFDYWERARWNEWAADTERKRRMLFGEAASDESIECKAPSEDKVSMIHLDCAFPYDTIHELDVLHRALDHGTYRFREALPFECERLTPSLECLSDTLHVGVGSLIVPLEGSTVGRRWRALSLLESHEIVRGTPKLKAPFAGSVFESDEHLTPAEKEEIRCRDWGLRAHNQAVDRLRSNDTSHAAGPDPSDPVCNVVVSLPADPVRQIPETLCYYDRRNLRLYVPLIDLHMQPRAAVTRVGQKWVVVSELDGSRDYVVRDDGRVLDLVSRAAGSPTTLRDGQVVHVRNVDRPTWDVHPDLAVPTGYGLYVVQAGRLPVGAVVDETTLVSHPASGRLFRLDTGRTWLDCETREIDHIWDCQRFVDHDKFHLYASLGRLFFHVGEKDPHQHTTFLEGTGGCGKSTMVNTQMMFWPPHKRGILSSNIEPLFGMSQVMMEGEAEVIFCNEVATNLKCSQEEWQNSSSGEVASYAVKNKKPLRMKCKAPHFWVGNSKPGFRNESNQMGRRLNAVLMPYPVRPRDGKIAVVIQKKLGQLQRREILAYREYLKIHGETDPMSVPERLPPAFREYHMRLRRETDPIQDFLSEGSYVKCDEDAVMLMERFRVLYDQYRSQYDVPKPKRWGDELYRMAFNERGIEVTVGTVNVDGAVRHNVEYITGLSDVTI